MSSVAAAQRVWTYRELVALPEDQLRHELIDGEHLVTPSPAIPHQVILWNLTQLLGPYLRANPIGTALAGPVDVKFSLFTVMVPDLVYFTAERFARVVNAKHATAAPDLVVEILSPGTRRRDKGRKRAIYDREGVREYWIVDPEARSITALRRPRPDAALTHVTTATLAADATLESPVFPGLRIPLREVFRGR
jgi:Uma2 family endonuclease